ncbi:MAG: hypothetical protein MUC90_05490 [Thermoplasmata archaeon]|nr:hypothetical protein [Thermoplasmata archaeon]
MTAEEELRRRQERFAYYMDLVGHDVLNNNQAVLGYLELMLANPDLDRATREYALKAITNVRISTALVENIKRALGTRGLDPGTLRPINLLKALLQAERDLKQFFPARKISVTVAPKVDEAYAVGDAVAQELLLHAMVNLARLDREEKVVMKVTMKEQQCKGRTCWFVTIEDANAELPASVLDKDIEDVYTQDISTSAKLTGMLFARMIASRLGGEFNVKAIRGPEGKTGAAFTLALRKANKP